MINTVIEKKIIITAPVHPYLIDELTAHNYTIVYEPAISYEGLLVVFVVVFGFVVFFCLFFWWLTMDTLT